MREKGGGEERRSNKQARAGRRIIEWEVKESEEEVDAFPISCFCFRPAVASPFHNMSESRLYSFSPETKEKLRKFRLGTSRAKDPQAIIYPGNST
ncbi:hypothetical protein ASPTUDRAFT_521160 [Aspergillus tubingensis CBS 134.48]|uniref:Uncharacterized protein n=1 Tax=Aspergillus tubingensis (strain CBS 134.48) TaxID=767770 RepID=A0A1L9ND28_ASPTC|nr:hypothetical protein ASPTUDRAFT_521160 [Aspergillus tubingensis CBS 134.48]